MLHNTLAVFHRSSDWLALCGSAGLFILCVLILIASEYEDQIAGIAGQFIDWLLKTDTTDFDTY